MLAPLKQHPEHMAAIERLKEWARQRFSLRTDTPILVAELACGLPGCPPVETVIVFWSGGEQRHQLKLFKPVAAVVPDDLPPSWMKNALIATDELTFECC